MLVWKAMPSITPMMLEMRELASRISPMVDTMRPTASPPSAAMPEAPLARLLAREALSELARTLPAICSIEAAVCCRLLACCSVRSLRSLLPWAICWDARTIAWIPSRTSPTRRESWPVMSPSARCRWPISSRRSTTMRALRSPWATEFAWSTHCCSGCRMLRRAHRYIASVAASSSTVTVPIEARPVTRMLSKWVVDSSASRLPETTVWSTPSRCFAYSSCTLRSPAAAPALSPALSLSSTSLREAAIIACAAACCAPSRSRSSP